MTASRTRTAIAVLALALGVFLALAGPASAKTSHQLTAEFGSDGNVPGTAFAQISQLTFNRRATASTSSIGATWSDQLRAPSTALISPRLVPTPRSAAGFPLSVQPAGETPDLATDNTALGSAGNIYYVSESHGLYGFDSTGFGLAGFPVPKSGNFVKPCGAAVDPSGNVWVGDYSGGQAIKEYSSAGASWRSRQRHRHRPPLPRRLRLQRRHVRRRLARCRLESTPPPAATPPTPRSTREKPGRSRSTPRRHLIYVVHSEKVDVRRFSGNLADEFGRAGA